MGFDRKAFVTFHGEMSWLRKLGLETFRWMNPKWEMEILDLPVIPELPGMTTAQRSDMARYQKMSQDGGLYFDTDIIWLKPIPEEWREIDVGVTIDPVFRFSNIGLLVGSPNRFWSDVYEAAIKRYKSAGNKTGYQLLGVNMLNRMFWNDLLLLSEPEFEGAFEAVARHYPELKWKNFEEKAICPINWSVAQKLHRELPFVLPTNSYGVHWFGGHEESKEFEKWVTPFNFHERTTYLTRAIRAGMARVRPMVM